MAGQNLPMSNEIATLVGHCLSFCLNNSFVAKFDYYYLQTKFDFLICYSFNCTLVFSKTSGLKIAIDSGPVNTSTSYAKWWLHFCVLTVDNSNFLRHCFLLENYIGRFLVLKHWESEKKSCCSHLSFCTAVKDLLTSENLQMVDRIWDRPIMICKTLEHWACAGTCVSYNAWLFENPLYSAFAITYVSIISYKVLVFNLMIKSVFVFERLCIGFSFL